MANWPTAVSLFLMPSPPKMAVPRALPNTLPATGMTALQRLHLVVSPIAKPFLLRVLGRAGIVARCNGVRVADAAVGTVDRQLTAAVVLEHLPSTRDRLCLRVMHRAGAAGAGLVHGPSPGSRGRDIAAVRAASTASLRHVASPTSQGSGERRRPSVQLRVQPRAIGPQSRRAGCTSNGPRSPGER